LHELGYGQASGAPERLDAVAAELVKVPVDVIIEAEEDLSPAIDACLPTAGVFLAIARER
jgi:hypothetical protein